MTKIILKVDQSYVAINGGIKFGKKDSCVNADNSFLPFIMGKYCLPNEVKEDKLEIAKSEVKPINKMNKVELMEVIKLLEIDISDEELMAKTKAQLMELINEQQ